MTPATANRARDRITGQTRSPKRERTVVDVDALEIAIIAEELRPYLEGGAQIAPEFLANDVADALKRGGYVIKRKDSE